MRGGFNLALSKQIHLYTLDTSAFYNKEEQEINDKMKKKYIRQYKLNKIQKKE